MACYRDSFTFFFLPFISDKINIFALVDAHIDTCVEVASRLKLPVSMLNAIVKNREEISPSSRNH
jgi:hypothetical protein